MASITDMRKRFFQIRETLDTKEYGKKLKRNDPDALDLLNELYGVQKKINDTIGDMYKTSSYTEMVKEELLCYLRKLEESKHEIDGMIDSKLAEVSHWKYATGEYFHPVPYWAEIKKFKRGRILKNIAENERFNKKYVNSYGYNESNQLIVEQCSTTDDYKWYGVSTRIYTHNLDKGWDSYNVTNWKLQQDREYPSNFCAVNIYKSLDDGTWLFAGLNSNKVDMSSIHYIYDGSYNIKHVVSGGVRSSGSHWDIYDFIYGQEGQLEKIMIYDSIWWENTKNPKSKRIK